MCKWDQPPTPKPKKPSPLYSRLTELILRNVQQIQPFLVVNEQWIGFNFYRHLHFSNPFSERFITMFVCLQVVHEGVPGLFLK